MATTDSVSAFAGGRRSASDPGRTRQQTSNTSRSSSHHHRRRLTFGRQLVYGLVVILISLTELCRGLRDVRITVPPAVKKGDNANLICNYDMEGDTLYTVKYYKGRREFYRYTPKENPAIKVFPHPGIRIEEHMSNGSNIVLLALDTPLSGKYSCEVSADAPSFHTTIVSAEMEVVETPEQSPSITGIQSRYRIGDIIKGNCSSVHSRPAANLTWTINDIPVPKMNVFEYKVVKNLDNTESSTVGIHYMIQHTTFVKGRIKLGCTATIYNVYKSFSNKIIEEVIPRILATGHNGAANLRQPYDESSSGVQSDHQMDENGVLQREHDLYLQQYNDLPSSATALVPAMGRWLGRGGGGEKWISGGGGEALMRLLSAMALVLLTAVVGLSWLRRDSAGEHELVVGRCHRKGHIVRAISSQYLIIVASLVISAIVTRFRC